MTFEGVNYLAAVFDLIAMVVARTKCIRFLERIHSERKISDTTVIDCFTLLVVSHSVNATGL
jgi:hypothetical protein